MISKYIAGTHRVITYLGWRKIILAAQSSLLQRAPIILNWVMILCFSVNFQVPYRWLSILNFDFINWIDRLLGCSHILFLGQIDRIVEIWDHDSLSSLFSIAISVFSHLRALVVADIITCLVATLTPWLIKILLIYFNLLVQPFSLEGSSTCAFNFIFLCNIWFPTFGSLFLWEFTLKTFWFFLVDTD